MEATAVSIGKAVLDGALDYAKSAAAEEVALQLGVESDVGFVADELEMMQSFLMTADEERYRSDSKLLTAWVKQVRNVAYNVEDSLVDLAIQAEQEKPPLLGCMCIPRNLCDRRRIAMEVKELKAKVEDVSNRNKRYRLIRDRATGSSKAAGPGVEQGGGLADAAAVMFGIDAVAVEENMPKVELVQLITGEADLRVIAVWGTSGDLGKMSEIRKAYDDQTVKAKFGLRAWVRLMHPFDPKEFLQSLVRQFYVSSAQEQESGNKAQQGTTVGGNVLLKMEKMGQSELVHVYGALVSSNNSYLIVIDGLSTIDEWDLIKTFFPDKKNGSRIVVATQQVEVASLCTEQPYQVSELKHLSADQTLYVFHKKVEKPVNDSAKPISKSIPLTSTGSSLGTSTLATEIEIEEEGGRQPYGEGGRDVLATTPTAERKLDRIKTRAAMPEDVVVGRATEKHLVIDLVGRPDSADGCKVISIWGMGGIGKTTLVRSVYRSQELGDWKRAWATALRPFNRDALLRNLALQLQKDIQEDLIGAGAGTATQKKKNIGAMGYDDLAGELSVLLGSQNCLIVLDDLSSVEEWDSVKHILAKSRRIIITTRERTVAKHCSEDARNMYNIKGLEDDAALGLFKKKVSKDDENFYLHPGGMHEQAKLIIKKCDGLPLAISTIGGYLANKPKTVMEWRKLNDSLSAQLEINPELKMIKTVLMRSYDGLPFHLKACFLYLSIFPEDHIIQRKSLVRRWIVEGYSKEMQHMTAHQVGDEYFDELLDRSMVLPTSSEGKIPGNIDSCQLHDLLREICMSKAREENLVFTLEEGCNPGGTHGQIRHLSISSNWKRDKDVMQRMLDLSHLRSLTVFGEWRSFFLSDKMRFLRVLDLEHTVGLRDHHLDQVGGLLHLRYLSLRGCRGIFELPSSLGNLRQLQTLDVRGTRIWVLPTTVTKLQKLQYVCTSGAAAAAIDADDEQEEEQREGSVIVTQSAKDSIPFHSASAAPIPPSKIPRRAPPRSERRRRHGRADAGAPAAASGARRGGRRRRRVHLPHAAAAYAPRRWQGRQPRGGLPPPPPPHAMLGVRVVLAARVAAALVLLPDPPQLLRRRLRRVAVARQGAAPHPPPAPPQRRGMLPRAQRLQNRRRRRLLRRRGRRGGGEDGQPLGGPQRRRRRRQERRPVPGPGAPRRVAPPVHRRGAGRRREGEEGGGGGQGPRRRRAGRVEELAAAPAGAGGDDARAQEDVGGAQGQEQGAQGRAQHHRLCLLAFFLQQKMSCFLHSAAAALMHFWGDEDEETQPNITLIINTFIINLEVPFLDWIIVPAMLMITTVP